MVVIGFIVLLLLADGLNILTVNWEKRTAEVLEVNYSEYIIGSKSGSRVSTFTNAKIKYLEDEKEIVENIFVNRKLKTGENIEIRIGKNGVIKLSSTNSGLYYYIVAILILDIVIFLMVEIYQKTYNIRFNRATKKK